MTDVILATKDIYLVTEDGHRRLDNIQFNSSSSRNDERQVQDFVEEDDCITGSAVSSFRLSQYCDCRAWQRRRTEQTSC